MKLLYTKRSPFARKVRVIALEKNIPLDLVDEDLGNKSRQLLDANPLGKVPTLLLDDGRTIYDSPVICQYLDEMKEEPIFIPRKGPDRYKVLKWEAMADDLMVAGINCFMEKSRHPQDFHAKFIEVQEGAIRKAYAFTEAHLAELKAFNLAPVAVASAIGYIHFRLPHMTVQGKLADWFKEISQRPSMAKTVPVA